MLDDIRGPLAGFMAAAMIFAGAGASAAQDNTSAAGAVIQAEIIVAGQPTEKTKVYDQINDDKNDVDEESGESDSEK